jgi:hypothetical protein
MANASRSTGSREIFVPPLETVKTYSASYFSISSRDGLEGAVLLGLLDLLPEVVADVLRANLIERLGLGRVADMALVVGLRNGERLAIDEFRLSFGHLGVLCYVEHGARGPVDITIVDEKRVRVNYIVEGRMVRKWD